MKLTSTLVSHAFKLTTALLLCFAGPAQALDDSNRNPLVTLSFPLDNKSETTLGHVVIRYILYPSGMCDKTRDVFGHEGKPYTPPASETAWLSQSHVDAVLKLVATINSFDVRPEYPIDAIIMQGTATNNKRISRGIRPNIDEIRLMLELLGGIRGDLEQHLAEAASPAKN